MLCWQSDWAIGKCVIDAGAHAARDLSCGTCACSMASGRPFEIPRFAESVRLMLAGRCAFAQVNGASCNVANWAAKFPPARLCTATRRTAISHGWPHDMCSHDGTGPNRGPARPYATKRTPRDPSSMPLDAAALTQLQLRERTPPPEDEISAARAWAATALASYVLPPRLNRSRLLPATLEPHGVEREANPSERWSEPLARHPFATDGHASPQCRVTAIRA